MLPNFIFKILIPKALSIVSLVVVLEAVADPNSSEKCLDLNAKIEARQTTLNRMLSSLDSLIKAEGNARAPLAILFQIELTNDVVVQDRIDELKRESSDADQSAFEGYQAPECSPLRLSEKVTAVMATQNDLTTKRIDFLSLPRETRIALVSRYVAQRNSSDSHSGLKGHLDVSRQELKTAKANLAKTEEQTASEDEASEPLLVRKAALENYIIDLESENISFIELLKEKKESLRQLQEKFVKASRVASSPAEASQAYSESTNIWEASIDRVWDLFTGVAFNSKIQPAFAGSKSPAPDFGINGEVEIVELMMKVEARRSELVTNRTEMLNSLKIQSFGLLQDAGELRARSLEVCERMNCDRPRGLNSKNLELIFREMRVVPLKFYAGGLSKWIEVRTKAASGFDGWVDLAKQSFIMVLLILLPYGLLRAFRGFANRLDELRKGLISKSMLDYRQRTNAAIWIGRVVPFVPSIGMIVAAGMARYLIGETDLSILASLLFYFQIFYIYRCARLLLGILLEIAFSSGSVEKTILQENQLEKSATFIARVIFSEYVVLHLIQDTVRRALAYQVYSVGIFWANIGLVLYESYRWRDQIIRSFAARFPGPFEKLQPYSESKLVVFVLPLAFVLILVNDCYNWSWQHLAKFDFVKRMLSEVLRKRLEHTEAESKTFGPVPKEYIESFRLYSAAGDEIFIERERSVLKTASPIIQSWIGGTGSDDLLLIVGDRGMGKSTTLEQLHKRINSSGSAKLARVPPRILQENEMYSWLSEVLEAPVLDIKDVLNVDQALNKKIILFVDEIHNFFLGQIGGFLAYKLFIEVISLETKNIFWCLTVNSLSWAYLKGVFGPEHFYGKILPIVPWRDYEIQKLILTRHEQSGYRRSFDRAIKAYGAEANVGQKAEAQFFRLLWGQSRGNPRSAQMYWISALTSPGIKEIHVGVPSFVDANLISAMSDSALFLLSAIGRHENLTQAEIRSVTGISSVVVRKALKECHDKELIWTDSERRIRISSRAQYVIDYFLTGKNFLYE